MIPDFTVLKLASIGIILLVTLCSGFIPFYKRLTSDTTLEFPLGQALAAGIFLGAALLHMLADSSASFIQLGYHYPFAFLLAGAMFLALLLLEHIGREIYQHEGEHSWQFAALACLMLSVHSLLEGAALGLASSWTLSIIILIAIMAHKWAASFALAVQINRSKLKISLSILLFLIFAVMTPIGIFFGTLISTHLQNITLLAPIFNALAAGTFLYLGTLHGLSRAVMVQQCCNLNYYSMVIVGFIVMAVVAIWS
jgi:zinc transporter 1/2/3